MNKPNLKWRFPFPACRFQFKDSLMFQTYLSGLVFWPLSLTNLMNSAIEEQIGLLLVFLTPLTVLLTLGYSLVALWKSRSIPQPNKKRATLWLLTPVLLPILGALGLLLSVFHPMFQGLLAFPLMLFIGLSMLGSTLLGFASPVVLYLLGFYREPITEPLTPQKEGSDDDSI